MQNSITTVPGVRVGHVTLAKDAVQTGVTAILPTTGNIFRNKLPAAVHVINGYGKSLGLVQVEELGTIESPIILTNTLSVGTAHQALVRYLLAENPEIGETGSVNPLVFECYDGELSDIRGLHITEEHVFQAIAAASEEFDQGAVGAGRGMICYDLKGGIGTASKTVSLHENSITHTYEIGALVLTNFGSFADLRMDGDLFGKERLHDYANFQKTEDKGSIIVILATNAPCTSLQLKRIAKRAQNGIARTGSYTGNGSGEICLAFSTAEPFSTEDRAILQSRTQLNDRYLNRFFAATSDIVESAILSSLRHAKTVTGKHGRTRYGLNDFLESREMSR